MPVPAGPHGLAGWATVEIEPPVPAIAVPSAVIAVGHTPAPTVVSPTSVVPLVPAIAVYV